MINRLNFFLAIFILSLTFVRSIIAEEFYFNTPEILVLEEGNLIKSLKGGNVKTNDNITIYADEFEYNKISSILIATGNVKAINIDDSTEIDADKITYIKNQEKLIARDNVVLKDIKKNILLETDELIYERKKEKITSIDETKILVEDKYNISSKNVIFLRNQDKVISDNFTELKDNKNYIYSAENFRYFLDKKIFRGKNLYILTKEEDKYYFKDGMLNLVSKEIAGKDVISYFSKEFSNPENEPRLKGNIGFSNENETLIKKGAFTSCKSRGDKCPPWVIEAQEIKHDKSKKTIYYKNAWLKVYNIPVLYYPRFFHPDPTVERQSGFLKPSFSDSQNLGSSFYLPYFYVLSESKDLTIKPRVYEDDKSILQTEFRSVTKNSSTIADVSYASGHRSYKEDDKDSRGHFFAKSAINLDLDKYSESQININLEKTTNDTYLKLFQLESPLLYDRDLSTLNSELVFTANNEDLNVRSSISVYEKLNGSGIDRYEYIFPDFNLSKDIDTLDYPGFLEFNSSGSSRLFDTNKSETTLINDLIYTSDTSILNNGIRNNYNILLKNFNSTGKNSSNFNSSLNNEFNTTFLYKSSYPLKKNGTTFNDYLTPKIIFRYSPDGMNKKVNNGLDISNVFATNRVGVSDTFESGKSMTVGFEYNKNNNKDKRNILSMNAGTIYRMNTEDNLGTDNSMNEKKTDVVANIMLSPFESNYIDYNFAMTDDLNTINSHSVTTQISINNFVTTWNYVEDFVGNSATHSINNENKYIFDNSNSIGFSTSRNKKINFTEYYNAFYEYQNDCLTAKIKYNKSYYEDRDIKPTETLFFSISIVPLGGYETQNMLQGF